MMKREAISAKTAKTPEALPPVAPAAAPATQLSLAELGENPVGHASRQVPLLNTLVPKDMA